MARFHYTVKLENGKVAARTSDRTYTHAVVCNGVRPEQVKRARLDEVKSLEQQIEKYGPVARGEKSGDAVFYRESTAEAVRARYASWVKDCEERLVKAKASIVEGFHEPTVATQCVLGWAGSLELANKRARTEQGYWAGVRVLPVEVREIAKRAEKEGAK